MELKNQDTTWKSEADFYFQEREDRKGCGLIGVLIVLLVCIVILCKHWYYD